MKEREEVSTLAIIWVLIELVIVLFTIAFGPSPYEHITGDNELNHRRQIKKVEIHKTKHIKRLYKDAFNEKR